MMVEHVIVTELVLTVELCISEREREVNILVMKVKKSFIELGSVFSLLNMFLAHQNDKPGLIYCRSCQTRVSVGACDAG